MTIVYHRNPSADTFLLVVYSGRVLAESLLTTQGYFNFATELITSVNGINPEKFKFKEK